MAKAKATKSKATKAEKEAKRAAKKLETAIEAMAGLTVDMSGDLEYAEGATTVAEAIDRLGSLVSDLENARECAQEVLDDLEAEDEDEDESEE